MTRTDSRRPGDVGKTLPACGPHPTGPGRLLADLTDDLRRHALLIGFALGLLVAVAVFTAAAATTHCIWSTT